MSHGRLTEGTNRDYGAIASTSQMPDVNFSGFSPTEVMSISEDIAQNIQQVHSSCKKLEKMLKTIGTPRESSNTRSEVHSLLTHTNKKIHTTTEDVKRLRMVVQRGDKQQKLQLEKLTTDFQTVVTHFSSLQKNIATVMRKSLISSPQENDEESLVRRMELEQQQLSIEADMQNELAIQEEREQQVKEIEKNISDVNTTMRIIATMVHDQAAPISSIEAIIDRTADTVESGREELVKASAQRQSHRRRILILLIIAVVIGLIVTGIIVGKLMG